MYPWGPQNMLEQCVVGSPFLLTITPPIFTLPFCSPSSSAAVQFLPIEQSGPIQLGSQLHSPVSGMKAPWPWHWSGHWALGSSQWSPPQPGLQWHSPFTQMPLLEHVGSRQSTAFNQRYTNVEGKHREKQNEQKHRLAKHPIWADVREKWNIMS